MLRNMTFVDVLIFVLMKIFVYDETFFIIPVLILLFLILEVQQKKSSFLIRIRIFLLSLSK